MGIELNQEQLNELKARAEADAKKTEAEAKVFDVDDFTVPDEVQEVYIEGAGRVRYRQLSTGELMDLFKNRGKLDDNEIGLMALTTMLSKADPKVTLEKVKALKPSISSKVMNRLVNFLT